ncbi:Nuclear pore complex protein [Forsythia ovata]|uniref:Nuclear pore complex protein n=1 Tax=Forsythia ovata TaxID=205694 RepID=A0ABD1W5H7_9LAMI
MPYAGNHGPSKAPRPLWFMLITDVSATFVFGNNEFNRVLSSVQRRAVIGVGGLAWAVQIWWEEWRLHQGMFVATILKGCRTFGASSSLSLVGSSSSSAFGSSTSIFGSSSAPGTSPSFGSGIRFVNTRSSPPFQSAAPSLGQATSAFGQTTSAFGQTTMPFGQSNLFCTHSTRFGGNLFSSTPSLLNTSNPVGFGQTTPSLSTSFQPSQPTQEFWRSVVAQSALATNPFGTLPAMPQISIGRIGTSPSIQYGISSLPVLFLSDEEEIARCKYSRLYLIHPPMEET